MSKPKVSENINKPIEVNTAEPKEEPIVESKVEVRSSRAAKTTAASKLNSNIKKPEKVI